MVKFYLRTLHRDYPEAIISAARYPKQDDDEPDQTGWRVVAASGEPIGQPTVNLWSPPTYPAEGCVFIKITPQFDGWLDSLKAAGLVEETGRVEGAGFVDRYAAECRVLDKRLLIGGEADA